MFAFLFSAAAAAAAAAAASAASASSAVANTVTNIHNSAVSLPQQTVVSSSSSANHSAILSLLNSSPTSTNTSPSVANPTLNNLLKNTGHIVKNSQFNPQVVAGKMTITNLLNSNTTIVSQSISNSVNSSTPVRVSISSLANQLSSPLMQQTKTSARIVSAQPHLNNASVGIDGSSGNNSNNNSNSNSLNSPIDSSVINSGNTQTFTHIGSIQYAGSNVQSALQQNNIQTMTSGSIQTLSGTLTPAPSLQAISSGNIQTVGSVQTNLTLPPGSVNVGSIRRLSVSSVNNQQSSSSNSNAPSSSIGLSMPGLKALLAGEFHFLFHHLFPTKKIFFDMLSCVENAIL